MCCISIGVNMKYTRVFPVPPLIHGRGHRITPGRNHNNGTTPGTTREREKGPAHPHTRSGERNYIKSDMPTRSRRGQPFPISTGGPPHPGCSSRKIKFVRPASIPKTRPADQQHGGCSKLSKVDLYTALYIRGKVVKSSNPRSNPFLFIRNSEQLTRPGRSRIYPPGPSCTIKRERRR